MKKKILIIIADIGNGHKSAAEALTSVFNNKYKDDFEVKAIDIFKESEIEPFDSADISYKFLSQNRAYESISNLTWKFTNTGLGFDIYKSYFLGRIFASAEKIIKSENPDLVISAYPLTCSIVQRMKLLGANFKYAVVITDLMTIHRSWADPTANLITCPTSDAVSTLIKYGVNINKIIYPLFPLKPELENYRAKEIVVDELKLKASKPIILITGGALGTKAIKKAIDKLAENKNLQLIVVAGRLDSFKTELENKYKGQKNIKILGFVNNMYDYLNACDILIGKPGATTVMEVQLFDKRAIFTRYIGEHDSGNVKYALRDPKIRYIEDDWDKIQKYVDELLDFNPRETEFIPKRSYDESEKIVEEIVKLIN